MSHETDESGSPWTTVARLQTPNVGIHRPSSLVPVLAIIVFLGWTLGVSRTSLLAAGVVLVTWLVLPAPFATVIAIVAAIAPLTIGPRTTTGSLIPIAVAAAFYVALVLETRPSRQAETLTVAGTGVLAGLVAGWVVWTGEDYWMAVAVLAVGTTTLMYALHRIALVWTNQVPEVTDDD